MVTESVKLTWGLYYEAGFLLSEVTYGLTLGFQTYKCGLLLTGCTTVVTHAERLTCSWAGYVWDQKSAGINAPPTDQSDQPVLSESDITIHKSSHGAQSVDHEQQTS